MMIISKPSYCPEQYIQDVYLGLSPNVPKSGGLSDHLSWETPFPLQLRCLFTSYLAITLTCPSGFQFYKGSLWSVLPLRLSPAPDSLLRDKVLTGSITTLLRRVTLWGWAPCILTTVCWVRKLPIPLFWWAKEINSVPSERTQSSCQFTAQQEGLIMNHLPSGYSDPHLKPIFAFLVLLFFSL